MPKYKKKITRLLEYRDFKYELEKEELGDMKEAFLTILFFAGCRVSEALALESKDIHCTNDIIYVQFFRLKGSKQTDPQELPREESLKWLCAQEGKLFPFSRTTTYRIVKKIFPDLYPHYFRMYC